jgi:hypothetical protein
MVIYIYVLPTMSHTIYAAIFEQTITHQTCTFTLIDGTPLTLILCLQVLIAHHIFINFGYVDLFQ